MLTLSPTISTFLSVLEYGAGGPVLQTWSPVVLLPDPTTKGHARAGKSLTSCWGETHVDTTFQPRPWLTHLVPAGQHV